MTSDRINRMQQNSEDRFDLAGKLIGFAMKAHRTLGPGFLEKIHQRALHFELVRAGFKAEMEVPIQVKCEGVVVGDFSADLQVEGELIVETKAVRALRPADEVQTVHYLTATGKDGGLLLNFGTQSLEFKKKFRAYQPRQSGGFILRENSVPSVNSV